jgi:hypothetical protein
MALFYFLSQTETFFNLPSVLSGSTTDDGVQRMTWINGLVVSVSGYVST